MEPYGTFGRPIQSGQLRSGRIRSDHPLNVATHTQNIMDNPPDEMEDKPLEEKPLIEMNNDDLRQYATTLNSFYSTLVDQE